MEPVVGIEPTTNGLEANLCAVAMKISSRFHNDPGVRPATGGKTRGLAMNGTSDSPTAAPIALPDNKTNGSSKECSIKIRATAFSARRAPALSESVLWEETAC